MFLGFNYAHDLKCLITNNQNRKKTTTVYIYIQVFFIVHIKHKQHRLVGRFCRDQTGRLTLPNRKSVVHIKWLHCMHIWLVCYSPQVWCFCRQWVSHIFSAGMNWFWYASLPNWVTDQVYISADFLEMTFPWIMKKNSRSNMWTCDLIHLDFILLLWYNMIRERKSEIHVQKLLSKCVYMLNNALNNCGGINIFHFKFWFQVWSNHYW